MPQSKMGSLNNSIHQSQDSQAANGHYGNEVILETIEEDHSPTQNELTNINESEPIN